MDIKQSEGNSRPQNLLTEAHCTVPNKSKTIWRKTLLFCDITMETEEHRQPWKTAFYSELPKVVRIQPQNFGVVANYKDVYVCLDFFPTKKSKFYR